MKSALAERERKVENGNRIQIQLQMQRVHLDRQKCEKRKSREVMLMQGAPSIENVERVEIHLNEYKQKRNTNTHNPKRNANQ